MTQSISNFCIIIFLCSLLISCNKDKPTQENQNANSSQEKPNIIVIFCDDLGYADVAPFGGKTPTPRLTQMAEQGVIMTDFYAASPVCSPSRAALLTGRYPIRAGVNDVFFPESFTGLDSQEVTIPEILKQKGYRTGIVGKWHLGHHYQFLPLQQGFDEYFGIPYSNDMASVVYMRGNEVVSFEVDQHYITQTYTQEAEKFIRKNHKEPFFLYLAHSMPHVPIYASPQFEGKSGQGLYADVIQELDWSTGKIIDLIDSLGLAENTLIIFTSDNGPWLAFEEEGGKADPLRGGKQFTFEGGMRVPMIARWKNKIPEKTVSKTMATTMDFLPTFAAMCGANIPESLQLDGENITEVLTNNKTRKRSELAYYWRGKLEAYRSDNWKIKMPYEGNQGIWWKPDVAAHDTLLFNLQEDISEKNNLKDQHPEKVKELVQKMKQFEQKIQPVKKGKVVKTDADKSHIEKKMNKMKQNEHK